MERSPSLLGGRCGDYAGRPGKVAQPVQFAFPVSAFEMKYWSSLTSQLHHLNSFFIKNHTVNSDYHSRIDEESCILRVNDLRAKKSLNLLAPISERMDAKPLKRCREPEPRSRYIRFTRWQGLTLVISTFNRLLGIVAIEPILLV